MDEKTREYLARLEAAEHPSFTIEDFDPSDTAPSGDPEHDCDGSGEEEAT